MNIIFKNAIEGIINLICIYGYFIVAVALSFFIVEYIDIRVKKHKKAKRNKVLNSKKSKTIGSTKKALPKDI